MDRDTMSNTELCWDAFIAWYQDNRIDFGHTEDREAKWDCWSAAVMAKLEAIAEEKEEQGVTRERTRQPTSYC